MSCSLANTMRMAIDEVRSLRAQLTAVTKERDAAMEVADQQREWAKQAERELAYARTGYNWEVAALQEERDVFKEMFERASARADQALIERDAESYKQWLLWQKRADELRDQLAAVTEERDEARALSRCDSCGRAGLGEKEGG